MPDFTKLTAQDLERKSKEGGGLRAKIREEYRNFIESIDSGEGGEARLTEGEKKITIKNRLKRGAEDAGKTITFIRSGPDVVRFRVEGEATDEASDEGQEILDRAPEEEPGFELPPPAEETQVKPKRGRKRKTTE